MPALFCFYQGLELLLKGFVSLKCDEKARHDMKKLVDNFVNYYGDNVELNDKLNYYISLNPPFIKEYCEINDISDLSTINTFYNSLRYCDINIPSEEKVWDYFCIKYPKNESFLPQIKTIIDDIDLIMEKSAKLFNELQ